MFYAVQVMSCTDMTTRLYEVSLRLLGAYIFDTFQKNKIDIYW